MKKMQLKKKKKKASWKGLAGIFKNNSVKYLRKRYGTDPN